VEQMTIVHHPWDDRGDCRALPTREIEKRTTLSGEAARGTRKVWCFEGETTRNFMA